jgi:hypothetical protein
MLYAKRTTAFPGAQSIAVPPVTALDCAAHPSLDDLVRAESAAGHGATIRQGRGFLEEPLSGLAVLCALPTPVISGSTPNPVEDLELETTVGTNFGAAVGQVWIGDAGVWLDCVHKKQQTTHTWTNVSTTYHLDRNGFGELTWWVYVVKSTGERSAGWLVTVELPP